MDYLINNMDFIFKYEVTPTSLSRLVSRLSFWPCRMNVIIGFQIPGRAQPFRDKLRAPGPGDDLPELAFMEPVIGVMSHGDYFGFPSDD